MAGKNMITSDGLKKLKEELDYLRDVRRKEIGEQLKEARQQAQKLIVEAEQEMDQLYRSVLAAASAEANAQREEARRQIDVQRDQALVRLSGEADGLADLIVSRLLAPAP